jgi:hypothetical protein
MPFEVYRDKKTTGLPKGLTVAKCEEKSYEHEGETHTFMHTEYLLPEAGPTRSYPDGNISEGVVLPIGGKNYLVQVLAALGGDEDYPTASSRKVLFTETDEPETPFKTWSNEEVVAERIQELERGIAKTKEELAKKSELSDDYPENEDAYRKYVQEDLERVEKQLQEHKDGKTNYCCNSPIVAFGQPQFIQNPAYPLGPNGECAMHLMTLNTNWGDCGNEVLLFTVDEDGKPNAVFHEASCC